MTATLPKNTQTEPDLQRPELYINRELSQLAFNRRVFEQSKDATLPLLERMRFMCITSSNLDEFFEIRVSGLKQQVEYGSTQTGADGLTPGDVLHRISVQAHELVQEQYEVLNENILPALGKEGIRFLRREEWTSQQREWAKSYFNDDILPVITPIRLDPCTPLPPDPQQEPELHRPTERKRRLRQQGGHGHRARTPRSATHHQGA